MSDPLASVLDMDFDGFWGLVEGSAVATSDQDERRAWLVSRLVLLPPGEIGDFAVLLDSVRARVDTWAHWQAAGGGELDDLLGSRGQVRAFDVSPGGEDVEMEDPADIARRLPRLWALFGKAS